MKKQSVSRSKSVKKTASRGKAALRKKTSPQAAKAAARTPRKTTKSAPEKKAKTIVAASKPVLKQMKPLGEIAARPAVPSRARTRPGVHHAPHVTRVATNAAAAAQHRQVLRMARAATFNYMRAPGIADAFDVGDTVEVFCDHERNGERVRGWIKGIVVQVDNKLVAVQFRSNVFLTDGWMVPDRILWYSLNSDQIRPASFAKRGSQKAIPDY